jgi:hypothetical protein
MIRKSILGKGVLGQSGGAQTVVAGNVDSGLATVLITPSDTEVYTSGSILDSNTALEKLTPSSADVYVQSDSKTGLVTFTPKTTAEGSTHSDSNTAIIKITSEVYETKKSGVVHYAVPPKNTVEFAAYLLADLEREIECIKANKRPTMPIYDRTSFPVDAVPGQHAIATDGSLWAHNGNWNLIAGS